MDYSTDDTNKQSDRLADAKLRVGTSKVFICVFCERHDLGWRSLKLVRIYFTQGGRKGDLSYSIVDFKLSP